MPMMKGRGPPRRTARPFGKGAKERSGHWRQALSMTPHDLE
jgi:hypothetical protein